MILGLIGTSGRDNNLTKKDFMWMYNYSKRYIKGLSRTGKSITLVSGGAAFSDHVAVKLFLRKKVAHLILALPTEFNTKFVDNGLYGFVHNPGRVCNYYHDKFCAIRKRNSYEEIAKAIKMGAQIVVIPGLHPRNRYIAENSEYMIAFGKSPTLQDGGTAYTYKLAKCPKEYIPIL